MKWVTRERPKIDRLACPWLIRRFVDQDAEIIYVPFSDVISKARELDAIPFDIAGVEYTHYENYCTFDYIVKKHNIEDPAVHAMAPIVRGADTDRHDLAAQSAGLWAISAGMAHDEPDDYKLLEKGMLLYDSLYSWAKYLQHVKHTQQPFENQLLDIFKQYLQQENDTKKVPRWARELKEIIQDQIDTNLNLNLKGLSQTLQVHPAYLSREFSKYFDDLSFGDYLRKLRIDKAIQLLTTTDHTLTEVAYLTGFSDQSHFARIFKKFTGKNPSAYRKNIVKK
jgi:AraC-like DNA-binding protein